MHATRGVSDVVPRMVRVLEKGPVRRLQPAVHQGISLRFLFFEQALRCIKGPSLAVGCRDVRARRVLEQEEGVIMQYVAEIAGLSNFMVSIVERCFEGRVSCRETAVRERS